MQNVVDAAKGRWRDILKACGVDQKFLSSRHGPCPFCGGVDRFRFDNKNGRGTFYCSQCGPGDGFDFLRKMTGQTFGELRGMVLQAAETATTTTTTTEDHHHHLTKMRALWHRAKPPAEGGPVQQYMLKRLGRVFHRPAIREARVFHDSVNDVLPAMVCMYSTTTGEPCSLHITYLTTTGDKAMVTPNRRNMKGGRLPPGCAIRLARVESTTTTTIMGIAEGIETALSCEVLFGIPVWAAGNATTLSKWTPPLVESHIVIFGDCDKSYTGQARAFELANKLTTQKKAAGIVVKIPPLESGDWNDVLKARDYRGLTPGETACLIPDRPLGN